MGFCLAFSRKKNWVVVEWSRVDVPCMIEIEKYITLEKRRKEKKKKRAEENRFTLVFFFFFFFFFLPLSLLSHTYIYICNQQ